MHKEETRMTKKDEKITMFVLALIAVIAFTGNVAMYLKLGHQEYIEYMHYIFSKTRILSRGM